MFPLHGSSTVFFISVSVLFPYLNLPQTPGPIRRRSESPPMTSPLLNPIESLPLPPTPDCFLSVDGNLNYGHGIEITPPRTHNTLVAIKNSHPVQKAAANMMVVATSAAAPIATLEKHSIDSATVTSFNRNQRPYFNSHVTSLNQPRPMFHFQQHSPAQHICDHNSSDCGVGTSMSFLSSLPNNSIASYQQCPPYPSLVATEASPSFSIAPYTSSSNIPGPPVPLSRAIDTLSSLSMSTTPNSLSTSSPVPVLVDHTVTSSVPWNDRADQFFRTKICIPYTRGQCRKGANCW